MVGHHEEDTNKWIEVVIGSGFEPVMELSLSAEGEALWLSWSEEERTGFLKTLSSK